VCADFEGGTLSSDFGPVLSRGVGRQIGLTTQRLADALRDRRHPSYLTRACKVRKYDINNQRVAFRPEDRYGSRDRHLVGHLLCLSPLLSLTLLVNLLIILLFLFN
jgi:hypothetical protein